VTTTFYALPVPTKGKKLKWKKVPKGTPGAERVTVESKKWYIVFKEGGYVRRVPAYTDKGASLVKLADFLKARERGESGLSDPYQKHYDRPILEHVGDYHRHVCAHSKDDTHKSEVERILNVIVTATKARSIRDITPGKLTAYLIGMTQAARTKNMHRRIAVMFFNWLEENGRVPMNPIGGKKVKTFKIQAKDRKRKRRGLQVDELRRLLVVAREQPLKDARIGRGGRPRRDGKRKEARPAELKPKTIAKLERRGRERELLYRIAIYTGLRRKELSYLRISHLHLDLDQPLIDLPGEYTKNGNPARIPLVPSLVTELRSWIADTARRAKDPVLTVPCKSNLSKIHRRLLVQAEIVYKDEEDRYADFHSLRKAANVLLRRAGIPLKDRMAFLRHGSAALTDGIYEDENQTDKSGILTTLQNAHL
jgi:integrase